MIKVPPWWFEISFNAFTLLPVEGHCEMALLRYLSKGLFASPQFQKYISYEGQLFFEFLTLSLLGREYLSSTANVITKSHNILYITNNDFFKLNILIGYQ